PISANLSKSSKSCSPSITGFIIGIIHFANKQNLFLSNIIASNLSCTYNRIMITEKRGQLWRVGLAATGAVFLAAILFGWVGLLSLIITERNLPHYPSGDIISDHSIYKIFPKPTIRRDTSYRSEDKFPNVYNWYSTHLNLGTERQAQSGCIHIFGSSEWLAFERHMSVTLCDTPSDRMIFVQHFILFDY
ncbi:MAG: hypothetical protein AAF485_05770, partial [Chloroflexota bacterium]